MAATMAAVASASVVFEAEAALQRDALGLATVLAFGTAVALAALDGGGGVGGAAAASGERVAAGSGAGGATAVDAHAAAPTLMSSPFPSDKTWLPAKVSESSSMTMASAATEMAAASWVALAMPASWRGVRAVGVNGTTEAAAGTVIIVLPTLLISRHGAQPP